MDLWLIIFWGLLGVAAVAVAVAGGALGRRRPPGFLRAAPVWSATDPERVRKCDARGHLFATIDASYIVSRGGSGAQAWEIVQCAHCPTKWQRLVRPDPLRTTP